MAIFSFEKLLAAGIKGAAKELNKVAGEWYDDVTNALATEKEGIAQEKAQVIEVEIINEKVNKKG